MICSSVSLPICPERLRQSCHGFASSSCKYTAKRPGRRPGRYNALADPADKTFRSGRTGSNYNTSMHAWGLWIVKGSVCLYLCLFWYSCAIFFIYFFTFCCSYETVWQTRQKKRFRRPGELQHIDPWLRSSNFKWILVCPFLSVCLSVCRTGCLSVCRC